MSRILDLKGREISPTAPTDSASKVVSLANKLKESAESGETVGAIIIFFDKDGGADFHGGGLYSDMGVVGALELYKHVILREWAPVEERAE